MIKVNTIPNVAYAVSCPGACRVTAPAVDGGELLLLEFDDGGGQGRFVAPGNLVWLSNAEAVVVGVALQAQDSAAAAIAAASAARAAAVQAADSAASTAESADMAAKSAEDAAGSASAASGSAEAASASATSAEGSAGAAAASAQAASGSAAAAAEHARSATDAESTAADAATDARNAATAAATSAAEAAASALSSIGVPISYLLSRQAQTGAEWRYVATQLAGAGDASTIEGNKSILDKIRQGKFCYPQFTTNGSWIFGQAWYGDSNSNFDTTTWEIVIDASSITTASVFLFDCLTGAFRRVFIFAPNMIQNQGASMTNMDWTHELDGVFTKLTTPGDMFANKARTHIMPWCAGKTIESLVNINNFMKNNVALPADQFPIGLPNVTNAQDAFLNCPLLTQDVADAILNSLPAVEAGSNGKGTITFTGTAAATAWGAEGADLTAVNAATGKGWTVEY